MGETGPQGIPGNTGPAGTEYYAGSNVAISTNIISTVSGPTFNNVSATTYGPLTSVAYFQAKVNGIPTNTLTFDNNGVMLDYARLGTGVFGNADGSFYRK
jgi:hypothetical protein